MPDCIFCKIINKTIPADIVYEDDQMIAFRDINPKAKYHFLIIPKEHIPSVDEINEARIELVGSLIYRAKEMARKFGFAASGYKLVFNCGKDGGQIVDHIHLHLLGGEPLIGAV
ncbi:histidine triad nucleotide-binding protein [Patescibacteria group bacterium]|nr:histidine triad nucleotide-binding protein [Patescibacteria group bacterium]MBU4511866.1 histidine triad nucleotide-binding protein [Patescibacteria group bacterium]